MGSLSALLKKIDSIPLSELSGQKPEYLRPNEMALTLEVFSLADIENARQRHPSQAKITRACYPRSGGVFSMVFNIPHSGGHTVTASYGPQGLCVTDNDKKIAIEDSVEALRNYIFVLTVQKTKAGA